MDELRRLCLMVSKPYLAIKTTNESSNNNNKLKAY